MYIIFDIYRWSGCTPPSRVHVCHNTYRVIADPTFAKGGELPQESYISHKRISHFRHLFLDFSHSYISIFNTSIAAVGIHERNPKIRVSKCIKFNFLWDFEYRQNWIQDLFSSYFSSPILNIFQLILNAEIFGVG